MEHFSHELHPYRAETVQWIGDNTADVLILIENIPNIVSATVSREIYLMIRHADGIKTLKHGDWIIKGEDGEVRFYTKEIFPSKYRSIPA